MKIFNLYKIRFGPDMHENKHIGTFHTLVEAYDNIDCNGIKYYVDDFEDIVYEGHAYKITVYSRSNKSVQFG